MDYLPYLYYITLHFSLFYSHSIVEGGFEEIS